MQYFIRHIDFELLERPDLPSYGILAVIPHAYFPVKVDGNVIEFYRYTVLGVLFDIRMVRVYSNADDAWAFIESQVSNG